MSALPYHKRYHGDALTGFMPLTLEERGAYQTLLDMMYDRGGPLIDNERLLAGYMNCSLRKWRQVREQLIAKHKITVTKDGTIINSRARKEIENQSKTQRKLIESGSKGGRARVEKEKKTNEISDDEQASLEQGLKPPSSHTRDLPEARIQKGSEDKSSAQSASDPIKELFDVGVAIMVAGGATEKQARSLIGKWRKAHADGDVLTALIEARTKAVSDPVEWLTKRLTGGEYVSASGYRYSGDAQSVMRQAEKRADWNTYWQAKGDHEGRGPKSASG